MATLHPGKNGDGAVAYVKGAPERIMEFCSHALKDGQPMELNEKLRNEIAGINEEFAANALRVMAGAYRDMPQGQAE